MDMKIPTLKEIEWSPLLWKEFLAAGSEWNTIAEFYPYFRKHAREIDDCKGIEMRVPNTRIRRLINGYIMLDLLEWDRKIMLRFKMWQLFEDLVGEMLREALKDKTECTVVHMDRYFKGLDYVITNSKSKNGWNVGIQCKRYIGSALPKCKLGEYGSWSKGTSAAQLIEKEKTLRQKWGSKKKFVLFCFNAFREKAQQKQRFRNLKKSWDCVIAIDRCVKSDTPYTYKIAIPELDKIVNWS
jgi:hypothetical protein